MLAQQSVALPESGDLGVLAQLGLVLIASGLALAPLTVYLVRRIFPGRNVVFARWGFSHAALVVLLFVALQVLLGFVMGASDHTAVDSEGLEIVDRSVTSELWFRLAASVAIFAAIAVQIAWFAHRLDPAGWRALGLWPGRNLRAVLAGLCAYGITLPAILGLGLVWPFVLERVGVPFEPQELLEGFRHVSPRVLPWMLVLGIVVQPLFEEILFRVFLQPLLVQNFSERGGILITSLIFAALHGASAFLPIFGISLLLGAIMLRTQRLSAVWTVHALHNGLTLLLFLAQDGDALARPGAIWCF